VLNYLSFRSVFEVKLLELTIGNWDGLIELSRATFFTTSIALNLIILFHLHIKVDLLTILSFVELVGIVRNPQLKVTYVLLSHVQVELIFDIH
jgi:hypothetical protein